jgi:hypothetical protein
MLHKIVAVVTAFMFAVLVPVSSNKEFDDIHGVIEFLRNDDGISSGSRHPPSTGYWFL